MPFPLGRAECRLFALGRHALWHGVGTLELEPGDEVLVPAYHHGSEVEALARAGLNCRFFAAADDLQPVEAELDGLVTERTRALVLIHYLGFPQDIARWRRWCDARGLMLIEDAAQAWLASSDGEPVGSAGDLAVFCLYKTVGVPDGAALVSRTLPDPPPPNAASVTRLARRHAAWLRSRIAVPARRPVWRPSEDADVAGDFALGDPGVAPAAWTSFVVERVPEDVAARRRANYELLLRQLGEHVDAPFDQLAPGASPFVFPLRAREKRELLRRLYEAGIHAFDFWSRGHPLVDRAAFAGVERRRRQTVGLPVHQELRPRDLVRIVAVVRQALARPPR
ncbi:MAG TPA: DegT/DnrJ/EryC1/StrS family aminotransferase [Gaiellaceae bacterium]|jgi:dTDP-4-amino-4,6-dideoxygalactose transaminase|nr:DegT/DnrJ/EryC1/StrS family aminotransferase [Gaiellaceae bacterium]